MNHKMRFPLVPKIVAITCELTFDPINYIEIDLSKLIDDYQYMQKLFDNFERKDQLDYEVLIKISEWLFEHYKKINHYILSNRILDSLRLTLSMANNKRDYSR